MYKEAYGNNGRVLDRLVHECQIFIFVSFLIAPESSKLPIGWGVESHLHEYGKTIWNAAIIVQTLRKGPLNHLSQISQISHS